MYFYHFLSTGTAIVADNKLGRYAGNALPEPLWPEVNQMLLHFVSDQLVSGKGFDISYTSSESGCGGDLSGTHGNSYGPAGYPNDPYPAGVSCIFIIEVPPNRQVRAHFRNLNIRYQISPPACLGDALRAYNGRWGQGHTWITGYCGRGNVNDIQGNQHIMSINFVSTAGTSDAARAGFTGYWLEWES